VPDRRRRGAVTNLECGVLDVLGACDILVRPLVLEDAPLEVVAIERDGRVDVRYLQRDVEERLR
jgi:hypothetical protein